MYHATPTNGLNPYSRYSTQISITNMIPRSNEKYDLAIRRLKGMIL